MTDTPGDVAAKLEDWALSCDKASSDTSWTAEKEHFEARAIALRAAASMLRDMSEREKALREALEPFANMDFLIIGGGSEAVIAMCDRARAALDKTL